jgi:hypothetical protein
MGGGRLRGLREEGSGSVEMREEGSGGLRGMREEGSGSVENEGE